MAKKTLEQLQAEYQGIAESQSELRRAGASAKDPAMRATADRLGKIEKQIKQAKGR